MKKLDLRYNLKCILKDREMSQVELAEKLDISPTNLNTRLARGKRCQIDLLDSISKILQVNIDELMTGQAATVINQPSKREEDQMYKEKYLLLLEEMNSVRRENNDLKDEILAKAKPLAKEKLG
jgi:DNA-binding Xre family transcriptional regulator